MSYGKSFNDFFIEWVEEARDEKKAIQSKWLRLGHEIHSNRIHKVYQILIICTQTREKCNWNEYDNFKASFLICFLINAVVCLNDQWTTLARQFHARICTGQSIHIYSNRSYL